MVVNGLKSGNDSTAAEGFGGGGGGGHLSGFPGCVLIET